YYNPNDELGVAYNDPAIGADWGIASPTLSKRDQANPKRSEIAANLQPIWGMRT
ncbi:MAG: dTDP-4-dehydrorhamnose 3,5-epimerase, partial [Acidimicrobiia bacterium]|nr:dTDP-4-dehydrorhamnose 3,5-epimerase [Acidimicrobiia bacterium]